MKMAAFFLALFFSLILQATVLTLPQIVAYAPNLVLIGVIMLGLLRPPRYALIFGAAIGLVEDINYANFLGETAFAYALAGYLAAYFRSLVMRESLLLGMLVCGFGNELFDWFTFATSRLFGTNALGPHAMLIASSRNTLATMLAVILLYPLYHRAFAPRAAARYDDDAGEG